MYPPAVDLGGADVQAWSDAEMFWIIKNGIRLTGMPGFGRALSDEEIWPLVHYIRTMPGPSGEDSSTYLPPEGSPSGQAADLRRALEGVCSESFVLRDVSDVCRLAPNLKESLGDRPRK